MTTAGGGVGSTQAVVALWSAAGSGVVGGVGGVVGGKRPEYCGRRRDSESVAAVASLHEEEGKEV